MTGVGPEQTAYDRITGLLFLRLPFHQINGIGFVLPIEFHNHIRNMIGGHHGDGAEGKILTEKTWFHYT